jgi:hypothetical protein
MAPRTLTFALGTIIYVFLTSCASGPQMPVSPLLEEEPSCHDEMSPKASEMSDICTGECMTNPFRLKP